MTLSKAEKIRRKKNKATKLYIKAHYCIYADKELIDLAKLTKSFFRCKSIKETIKEILMAFITDKMPFNCTTKNYKLYKEYIKINKQQIKEPIISQLTE